MNGQPDTAAETNDLMAFGLTLQGRASEDLSLWPENERIVNVFIALGSQWIVGQMGGLIGLRYEALPVVMRYCGIPRSEQIDVFHGLRVMESETVQRVNRVRP